MLRLHVSCSNETWSFECLWYSQAVRTSPSQAVGSQSLIWMRTLCWIWFGPRGSMRRSAWNNANLDKGSIHTWYMIGDVEDIYQMKTEIDAANGTPLPSSEPWARDRFAKSIRHQQVLSDGGITTNLSFDENLFLGGQTLCNASVQSVAFAAISACLPCPAYGSALKSNNRRDPVAKLKQAATTEAIEVDSMACCWTDLWDHDVLKCLGPFDEDFMKTCCSVPASSEPFNLFHLERFLRWEIRLGGSSLPRSNWDVPRYKSFL